jgi:cytoskeletal protein CcmA (bactofilin family)
MADARTTEMSATKLTVVEEGTEFRGSMSSSCPVLVKGRLQGEVSTPALTVTPSGGVSGRVKVGVLESQGELTGDFEADEARVSGRVNDETVIRAKSLEVKLSSDGQMVVTFGETRLEVGDAPTAPESSK